MTTSVSLLVNSMSDDRKAVKDDICIECGLAGSLHMIEGRRLLNHM